MGTQNNEIQVEDETEIDITEIIERIEKLENEVESLKSKLGEVVSDVSAIAEAIDESV